MDPVCMSESLVEREEGASIGEVAPRLARKRATERGDQTVRTSIRRALAGTTLGKVT